jgi:hypothetical protein
LYFAAAGIAGLIVQIVGVTYFVRRKTFGAASVFAAIGIAIVMFLTELPLSLLHDLMR